MCGHDISMKNWRWDIRIGLLSSLVAILGLTSSLWRSNTDGPLGEVSLRTQWNLIGVACFVAVLTAIKVLLAFRNGRLRP